MPTANDFNTYINDNLEYLLNPNKVDISASSGSFTATSTTWVNIDASLSTTIVTNGGPLLVGFQGLFYLASASEMYLSVTLDGVQNILAATVNTIIDPRGYLHGSTMLAPAAGAHSLALQWRASSAILMTLLKSGAVPLRFWAVEL
jgi:hypothetical protein